LRDLIQVGFDQVLGGIEALGGQVEHVDRRVGQVLERLEGLMQHLGLEDRVKPRDEFSQHNDRSLKLIAQALKEIERVPHSARGYSVAAIHMGSVLSSAGNLERAEQLFEQARDSARRPDEQALASFNLFQVRLRRKAYPEALAALEAAVAIDAARYALHNTAKYPVERILGAGGMGVAFLCRDRLRGHVVVKAFWEAAKGPIEEVFREVLILRDVAGRYVPAPYDYDYADPARQERPYIVTEYIEGAMDGEAWLAAHGRLDLAQGLQVGIEVARGLAAAHQAGVCHLDLKPANLLLEQTDQGIAVRIIDFGLARAVSSLRQDAAAQRSRSGKSLLAQEVFGTLEYAPPEQLGEVRYGPPGPKSDLYAFGATLYRLMTRRSPRALNRRALPPHSPEALYDLLCECVQEDPGHRPASASEVLQRLEALPRNRVYAPLEVLRDSLKDRTEGPEMVMIPPGRFVMGSPPSEEGRYDSEGPQHEVAIAQAFALGRFAVTVGDFRRFVQASGYKTEAETQGGSHVWDGKEWKLDKDRNWRSPGFEQGDDHPVVCVSWNDAQAYVRWLSEQTGERYRLPSEAEWEYACRAGTTRSRYWGDDPAQACRYGNVADKTAKRQFLGWEVHPCEDGYVYTAPVGKFQPNDFTLCDMLGNVWEWVEDCWHDSYNGAPADGSPWTSGGDRARRVFRGGSWGGEPRDVRSACRVGDGAGARSHYRGFRLARTL
jgi:formylglycine-generating enzyme required for sulfatase activity/tetratricopeptide (TPR) repeat protein